MKRLLPVIILVSGAIAVAAAMRDRQNPGFEADGYRAPVPPTRTSAAPPVMSAPPPVPPGADGIPPISFTVTTTWNGAGGQRRTTDRVTRTSDRVHILIDAPRKEWLLERNPVDPRRVSGYLVNHQSRQILIHQESDLRGEQQIRGWADALTMRFDPSTLSSLERTAEREVVLGAAFIRYRAVDQARDGVLDVWWSDALLLPLRLTVRQKAATVASVIDAVAPADGAALAALTDPRRRFANYEVLDVSDSRERRH